MSDAVKEMAEVPRQFVKEGTQVSGLMLVGTLGTSAHSGLNSSSTGAPSPHKRVSLDLALERFS